MGSKERRERTKAATRDRILEGARELLLTRGYDGLTMRALADRIEYSPTAIYVHFADKEALLTELAVCDFAAFASKLGGVPPELPARKQLELLTVAYLRFAGECPALYRHLFMTERPLSPEALAAKPSDDAYDLLLTVVRACLRDGLVHAGWSDRLDLVAQVFWLSLHGAIALRMTMPRESKVPLHEPHEIAPVLMEVLLRGFATPPPPDAPAA